MRSFVGSNLAGISDSLKSFETSFHLQCPKNGYLNVLKSDDNLSHWLKLCQSQLARAAPLRCRGKWR